MAAVSIDERVRLPQSAQDHAGFRAWATSDAFPDGLRAAFVDGEVILEMSPEAIESHNKVKAEIAAVLGALARDEDLGEAFADGVLVSNVAASLSCEPDAMFIAFGTFESGRARLIHKVAREDEYVEIEGSPDVVVEVVSDSSVRKDLALLRAAYLRARVQEYWIVDARGEILRFEIHRISDDKYVASAPPDAPQRSAVFERTFTLSRARNRAGRFTYRLSHAR